MINKNINDIFEIFLAERKKELAARTFSYYEDAVYYLQCSLNSYGYLQLDEDQAKIFNEKFEQNIEFCDQFSCSVLDDSQFSEFLGYFVPKKMLIGFDAARKICGATLNLYKWLVSNKLIEDKELSMTVSELRENFNYYWEEFQKPYEERDGF